MGLLWQQKFAAVVWPNWRACSLHEQALDRHVSKSFVVYLAQKPIQE